MTEFIFEPHNGYGHLDPDGEPWPFGYISRGVGKPVFELSTVFKEDPAELHRLALMMTAGPELLEALNECVAWIVELANSGDAGFWDPEKTPEIIQARAAIARATSTHPRSE